MGKQIEVTRDGAIFSIIDEEQFPLYEKKGFKKVVVDKKKKTVEEAPIPKTE